MKGSHMSMIKDFVHNCVSAFDMQITGKVDTEKTKDGKQTVNFTFNLKGNDSHKREEEREAQGAKKN